MNIKEQLKREKENLQQVFQEVKEQQQKNVVKVGLGETYSYAEFFLLLIFGILFGLIGLIPLVMGIASFFYPFDSVALTIFIWGAALVFEGVGLTTVIYYTRKNSRRNDSLMEHVVLKRAFENNGIIREQDFYVPPLSRWRSNRMIRRFLKDGTLVFKEYSVEGKVYYFTKILTEREKRAAKFVHDFK